MIGEIVGRERGKESKRMRDEKGKERMEMKEREYDWAL